MGVMHMEVDKVPEMMMDMKVDKVADKCSYLAQFSNGSGSGWNHSTKRWLLRTHRWTKSISSHFPGRGCSILTSVSSAAYSNCKIATFVPKKYICSGSSAICLKLGKHRSIERLEVRNPLFGIINSLFDNFAHNPQNQCQLELWSRNEKEKYEKNQPSIAVCICRFSGNFRCVFFPYHYL